MAFIQEIEGLVNIQKAINEIHDSKRINDKLLPLKHLSQGLGGSGTQNMIELNSKHNISERSTSREDRGRSDFWRAGLTVSGQ